MTKPSSAYLPRSCRGTLNDGVKSPFRPAVSSNAFKSAGLNAVKTTGRQTAFVLNPPDQTRRPARVTNRSGIERADDDKVRSPRSPPSLSTGGDQHGGLAGLRFPLSLRMVEEMLAARGIDVSHETVRRWAEKFGRDHANRVRRRAIRPGDTWHLDEVVITIAGEKHWLWRAVDGHGFVLDVLVQKRRDTKAAKRLMRKLLKKYAMVPRVMITDKLRSYAAAKRDLPGVAPSIDNTRVSTTGPKTRINRPDDGAHHETLQNSAACSRFHPRPIANLFHRRRDQQSASERRHALN